MFGDGGRQLAVAVPGPAYHKRSSLQLLPSNIYNTVKPISENKALTFLKFNVLAHSHIKTRDSLNGKQDKGNQRARNMATATVDHKGLPGDLCQRNLQLNGTSPATFHTKCIPTKTVGTEARDQSFWGESALLNFTHRQD